MINYTDVCEEVGQRGEIVEKSRTKNNFRVLRHHHHQHRATYFALFFEVLLGGEFVFYLFLDLKTRGGTPG